MKSALNEEITVPGNVHIALEGNSLTLKGEKGEASRSYPFPCIHITRSENKILIKSQRGTKREKKQLFAVKAHIKNQVRGVTEGHNYKLKICSGHFPMSVTVKGNSLEIKNFIGEKVPRVLELKQGVSVKLEGEIIDISGVNKEVVSQVAADIEKLTRRSGYDRRIFQDGIFITEKDGKKIK